MRPNLTRSNFLKQITSSVSSNHQQQLFFLYPLGQLDKMQQGSEIWRHNKKYMMTLPALYYIFYLFSSTTNITIRSNKLKNKIWFLGCFWVLQYMSSSRFRMIIRLQNTENRHSLLSVALLYSSM